MSHSPNQPSTKDRKVNITDEHPPREICRHCRFHGQFNTDYDCRLNPPQIIYVENEPHTKFPGVEPECWCGQGEFLLS